MIKRQTLSPLFVLLCLLLVMASCQQKEASRQSIGMNASWEFRYDDSSHWYPANVPGCIHTDLLTNGLINDPFYADNEQKQKWILEKEWIYQKKFSIPPELMDKDSLFLVFDGLDTHVDVFLNDSLLGHANNMFRTYRFECRDMLFRDKENTLRLHFFPAVAYNENKAKAAAPALPDIRVYSRKAPYHFGWDWGPEFPGCGIWRDVRLKAYTAFRIAELNVRQLEINPDEARLRIEAQINASHDCEARLVIKANKQLFPKIREKKLKLRAGENTITYDVLAKNPSLWWPAGHGKQNLYEISCLLKDDIYEDHKTIVTGLRDVKLIQQEDSIGRSFYFRVNGKDIFMKGANYIPQDIFLSRLTEADYHSITNTALELNMNMLRIWGGGIYEDDIFYDMCDRNGILLWQDFMFACAMYPGDSAFMDNVAAELDDNIKRLRRHPCIALWCGNNEISEAWHNWGWQKSMGYSAADSAAIWQDYLRLFHGLIPEKLEQLDPERPYWPSSPSIGWGREESLYSGDMHYWGVWWGMHDFELYKEKTGRFMSEYGFQAFPSMKSIRSFCPPQQLFLYSDALKNHQKHPRGFEIIQHYLEKDYSSPANIDNYVYISQLVQAYGIKTAIEAHRRAIPRCMGSLYWQLNDCWPVISWSGMDYYHEWKALNYFVKKAFKPILLSFTDEKDSIGLYLTSDTVIKEAASLRLSLMDFDGQLLYTEEKTVPEIGVSSVKLMQLSSDSLLAYGPAGRMLLKASYSINGQTLADNIMYFEKPKGLVLKTGKPKLSISRERNTFRISIKSDHLIKNVYLRAEACAGKFSDNFFDLLPGEEKIIYYRSREEIKTIDDILEIQSLNDMR